MIATNRLKLAVLIALLTGILSASAHADKTEITSNRRVAIASLDPSTAYGTSGPGKLGDVAADMLLTELSDRGASVIERSQIKKAEQEGELGTIGIVDAESAPKLGQKLGAEWMVVGRITEFGMSQKGFGTVVFGRQVGLGQSEARVKIEARIIDARTGLVLASAAGEGHDNKSSISTDVGNIVGFLGHVNFDSSEWTDSRMGKATQKAATELAENLAKRWDQAERKYKLEKKDEAPAGEAAPAVGAEATAVASSLKGMSVIVVIPETIFRHPHVPDPAAETEMIHQLTKMGVRVIDDQRAKELGEDREVMAMLRGNADPAKLQELKSKFGADILIVGEAIAEQNNQQVADLSSVFSRGRVEIRAIRMDTGEIMAADAEHAPGRDLSETLAGKNALQNAAHNLAPRFIRDMAGHAGPPNSPHARSIDMEIAGWATLSQANSFLRDLKAIKGVKSANRKDFRGGILFLTVEFNADQLGELADVLESAATLKQYHLAVQTASSGKIEAKCAAK